MPAYREVGLEGHNPNRVALIEGREIDLTFARGVADGQAL
jgi:hypothetical protein